MDNNRTFPSTKRETLALLYVQNQDLSAATPEEIATMYTDAYAKIDSKLTILDKERREEKRKQSDYF